jgi:hypothetical protein
MKHLLTTVLLIITAVAVGGTAEANGNRKAQAKSHPDLMAITLEGEDAFHYQAANHESCMTLIHELADGQPVMLTMRNPYVKGKVLQAHCILPDGSHVDWPADSWPKGK